MDAVKRFRHRRKMRLDARGVTQTKPKEKNIDRFCDPEVVTIIKKRMDADEDIDWISTDTGTHIPLKEGKAVGGPLKGREFKDAKTTGRKPAKTAVKRRGQIDTGHTGFIHEADLPEYNQKALKSIMEETGYSELEARKLQSTMLDYLGGDYKAYTKGGKLKEVEVINKGLERMPKFDGEMFRGMNFNHDAEAFKKFEGLEIGDELGMKSVSSWSSEKGVASNYGGNTSGDVDSVMLSCKTNKSGVGVQHISKWGAGEAEVMSPSTAKWKVTGKNTVSKYDYIKEYFSKLLENEGKTFRRNMWQNALKENEAHKDVNSRHKIVLLEVEEI